MFVCLVLTLHPLTRSPILTLTVTVTLTSPSPRFQCKKITSIFAKTFYLGTKLMEEEQKTAVWAIYVWCRRTDDLVDGPRALMNPEAMKVCVRRVGG